MRWKLPKKITIHVINPTLRLLNQGTSPHKLALTIAIGIIMGIVPLIGFISFVCLALAYLLRLNIPIMMAVFYTMYPIQLVLYIPFIQLGSWLFNAPPFPFSVTQLKQELSENWLQTLQQVGYLNLLGVLSWASLSIPIGVTLYFIFKILLLKGKQKKTTEG